MAKAARAGTEAIEHPLTQSLVLDPAEKNAGRLGFRWRLHLPFRCDYRRECCQVLPAAQISRHQVPQVTDRFVNVYIALQFIQCEQYSAQWTFPKLTLELRAL